MKRILLGVASVVALSSSAFAADLYKGGSLKDGPVYEAPAAWTGFYVGGNVGYGFSADRGDIAGKVIDGGGNPAKTFGTKSDAADTDGFLGGGQIGYRFQSGAFVLGAVTDIQGGDLSGDKTTSLTVTGASNASVKYSQEIGWYGTVRALAGVTAAPSLLVYATGGLAYGQVEDKFNISWTEPRTPPVTFSPSLKDSETRTGWTVGAGAEYALSKGWSVSAEYLYVDLGSSNFSKYDKATNNTFKAEDLDSAFHTARLGLNYKLGGNVYEPLK